MTNFQNVAEYRGSGILFSARKGSRKEVTQRLGRFRVSCRENLLRLYRPRNFSPPRFGSRVQIRRVYSDPFHESEKLSDVEAVEPRQFYLSTGARFFSSSPPCFPLNALCCQSCLCHSPSPSSFSLPSASLFSPLFSRFTRTLALTLAFLAVEITIITSRIRDKRRR